MKNRNCSTTLVMPSCEAAYGHLAEIPSPSPARQTLLVFDSLRMTASYVFVLVLMMLLTPAALGADKGCQHDEKNLRCVKYLKNYDGDTVTFDIPSLHPIIGRNISIRVNGLDTPEMRTKDKCEKTQGKKAKDLVAGILKKAKRIDLLNIDRGKYFRIVADVIADGKSLKDTLIASGLAYPYDGGTKSKINWCKSLKNQ